MLNVPVTCLHVTMLLYGDQACVYIAGLGSLYIQPIKNVLTDNQTSICMLLTSVYLVFTLSFFNSSPPG